MHRRMPFLSCFLAFVCLTLSARGDELTKAVTAFKDEFSPSETVSAVADGAGEA